MWFLFGEVSSSSGLLGMGYVILLWHSLSLPYNYFYTVFRFQNTTGSERTFSLSFRVLSTYIMMINICKKNFSIALISAKQCILVKVLLKFHIFWYSVCTVVLYEGCEVVFENGF